MPAAFDQIILSAVKRSYDPTNIKNIKGFIEKSKSAYLASFYKACFENCEKEKYLSFKKDLLKPYLAQTDTNDLLYGLDYMVANAIGGNPEIDNRVMIVNGKKDVIVTGQQVDGVSSLKIYYGHMTTLSNDFSAILNINHHHGKTRII